MNNPTQTISQRILALVKGGMTLEDAINTILGAGNGKLLASAPDLLKALEYANQQAPYNDPNADDSDLVSIEVTIGWVRELRAALTKTAE
jgi:hypothetical protein